MPELPEVEALARFLDQRLAGRLVTDTQVAAISAIKTADPPLDSLRGLAVEHAGRAGKFLTLGIGGFQLACHLARAGWLRWSEQLPDTRLRLGRGPIAVRLAFDDGSGFDLTEAGTQKRLAVYLVRDLAQVPGIARLGPDPLVLGPTEFAAILARAGRAQLKGVLTDQQTFAGIGNAYSDEILHAAKLSPFKPAGSLDPAQTALLFDAVRAVLGEAIERAVAAKPQTLKSEKKRSFAVHARTGEPCPVCGDTIREVSFADKSLQYCPTCQTGGKPLADRRMSRLLK